MTATRGGATLERLAREAWIWWGGHAKFTVCSGCDEWCYCRSASGRVWLCLNCHDERS